MDGAKALGSSAAAGLGSEGRRGGGLGFVDLPSPAYRVT